MLRWCNNPGPCRLSFFETELEQIKDAGLYRRLRRVEGDQGPTLSIDGREVINFSSNNYLGIANHPDLAAAAEAGHRPLRLRLGRVAVDFRQHDAARRVGRSDSPSSKAPKRRWYSIPVFKPTRACISTLAGEGDAIFSDALNHASIIDGCRLARAKTFVYAHNDLDQLEAELKQATGFRRKLIVTESIFSMDGDEAPLTGIVELAEKYGAMVMVDEAHATGIFGAGGAGVVQKLGLGDRVLVQMGTLGKALGGFGAYIAGSRGLRDLLINRCRSFIFTTSLPPAVMAMAMAALDLVKREPERREALWHNCRSLKEGLRSLGFHVGASESPILPLIIGDATECMRFSEQLLEKGVFAQGIRPPTVPPGTSRLRITLMATHTREQIDRALEAFKAVKEST